jgi:general secretion pathway protein E
MPKQLMFSFAKRHGVLLDETAENEQATVYYRPGLTLEVMNELRRFAQKPLKFIPLDPNEFDARLVIEYESDSSEAQQLIDNIGDDFDLQGMANALPQTQDLLENADDAPIIRLINALLSQAVKESASDIHIESFEDKLLIRLRIDGILHKVLEPQRGLGPLIISRIKVMAKLDIAEKRLPQDGRIGLRVAGRGIDIRVSTMPSRHGERVVMRLLDKQAGRLDLTHLGMWPESLSIMEKLLERPHGIILVTGPTGAGKTTTLYAGLGKLNEISRNILTVEDPIEYDLPGIGQTQVNTKVDMTFAKGLRAILRQDPDVVMIGEIRDLETAQIAVQASLTGHLVLSTLHTNTAIGAITRLHDMGVETFLIATSLVGMIAQRLVRLLCNECKKPHTASVAECELLGVNENSPPTIYSANGCETCHGLGYRGRTGIYELIPVDDKLRQMIHENTSEYIMERYAREQSPNIRQDGIRRVLAGQTSLEEVLRVTTKD